MPSPSHYSASPSGASPLDARLCAEIGAELARVRTARGLSVAQVGDRLLLSIRQVKALEEVDFAAFHNATFHVNALKKYAAFADLDPSLIAAIASAVARPEVVPVAGAAPVDPSGGDEPSRRGLMLAASVLVVAAVFGAGGYMLWARRGPAVHGTGEPATGAVPTPVPPPASIPEPLQPTVAPVTVVPLPQQESSLQAHLASSAFGSLRVPHSTWIFVRDADNVVIERTLADGEAIELELQPTYLAVGSTDAELTIGTQPIDLSRFVANGQIRIRAGDFDALVQGASPIPAPTAVAGR